MGVGAQTATVEVTGLAEVLEPEPSERVDVPNSRVWFGVRRDWHHNQIFAICCQFGQSQWSVAAAAPGFGVRFHSERVP